MKQAKTLNQRVLGSSPRWRTELRKTLADRGGGLLVLAARRRQGPPRTPEHMRRTIRVFATLRPRRDRALQRAGREYFTRRCLSRKPKTRMITRPFAPQWV